MVGRTRSDYLERAVEHSAVAQPRVPSAFGFAEERPNPRPRPRSLGNDASIACFALMLDLIKGLLFLRKWFLIFHGRQLLVRDLGESQTQVLPFHKYWLYHLLVYLES